MRYLELAPTRLIDQLRAFFHPKDRSVVLDDGCFIEFQTITKPDNPAAGSWRVYVKSDGKLYILNSAGTETVVGTQS